MIRFACTRAMRMHVRSHASLLLRLSVRREVSEACRDTPNNVAAHGRQNVQMLGFVMRGRWRMWIPVMDFTE